MKRNKYIDIDIHKAINMWKYKENKRVKLF